MQMFCFTRAQWLDVVDLHFSADTETSTFVKVQSTSTGLFPLIIPFASILNCLLFWVPFLDNGKNRFWIKTIANECLEAGMDVNVVMG